MWFNEHPIITTVLACCVIALFYFARRKNEEIERQLYEAGLKQAEEQRIERDRKREAEAAKKRAAEERARMLAEENEKKRKAAEVDEYWRNKEIIRAQGIAELAAIEARFQKYQKVEHDKGRLVELEREFYQQFTDYMLENYIVPPDPVPDGVLREFVHAYVDSMPLDAGLLRQSKDEFVKRCIRCASFFPSESTP